MKPIITSNSNRTLVLGEEMENKQPPPQEAKPISISLEAIPEEIPPKNILNGVSTKDLDGFREIRKQVKLKLLEDEFVSQTKKILELFDKQDKKYDSKVVLWACQSAEMYFVSHKKMGPIKERAVINAVKLFYNDDAQLVKSIIELVMPLVKKSNLLRRTYNRVSRFLLVLLASILSKE